MQKAKALRKKIVSKAVRNIKRGYADDDSKRGMYREEIRLDLQRSRLMTESYKQTDGQAMVIRRAKALVNILDNMDIFIRDHERIVGYQTADTNGIYHPIDQNWKSVQRLVGSEAGKTLLDKEGRKELDELCAYWKGKSMSDRHQEILPDELKKYWTYEGTFLWSQLSELGIPDYENLFKTGLKGRIKLAQDRIAEIGKTVPADYAEQKEFLQSVIIALTAVIRFAQRYSELAKKNGRKRKKSSAQERARRCSPYLRARSGKSAADFRGGSSVFLLYSFDSLSGIFHAGRGYPR